MLETSRAFFDLPIAETQTVARPALEQSRGYIGLGGENLSYSRGDATTTDLKEFFAIGPVDVPDDEDHRRPEAYPSFALNRWPARPPEFRAVWTEYYRAMETLAGRIMRIFAVALGLSDDFSRDATDRRISGIRANHYPERVEEPRPGQIRAGAHTMHRVVNPPPEASRSNRRLSIPFFQPNYDAVIECLPGCCGPDNPPRYEPVTSGQHRLTKFLRGVGADAPAPRI
jgi:isopenicillin N synthase-like dioxygenase